MLFHNKSRKAQVYVIWRVWLFPWNFKMTRASGKKRKSLCRYRLLATDYAYILNSNEGRTYILKVANNGILC